MSIETTEIETVAVSLSNEPSLTKTAALVHLGDVLVQLKELDEARARLMEARELDREHSALDGETRSRLDEFKNETDRLIAEL